MVGACILEPLFDFMSAFASFARSSLASCLFECLKKAARAQATALLTTAARKTLVVQLTLCCTRALCLKTHAWHMTRRTDGSCAYLPRLPLRAQSLCPQEFRFLYVV